MVNFTLSMLWWLACALFRFFVIAGTSYGIYKFFKDKIDERRIDKYTKKLQEEHKREMEEAKKEIAKMQKKK